MSYKVLALKWRPRSFDEIIGQEHVTRSLKNAINLNRVSHAFTFSGPRGVGKTTTARILSKELNKVDNIETSFDIIEMDAASNRGIDEIRNLRENASILPAHGKYKIYIIDEVHMLTKEAFNALLKTLEEPPSHVVFILATTDPYKIPSTIISRTQRYDFKRLRPADIIKQIKIILDSDDIGYDEQSLNLISEKADGSMRDALGFLDQILNYSNDKIEAEDVQNVLGLVDDDFYNSLLENILLKESLSVIELMETSLDRGISVQDFIFGFNRFLKSVLIQILDKEQKNNLVESLNDKGIKIIDLDIIRMMELTMNFESKLKFHNQPGSALEIFIIKLCSLDSVVKISDFLDGSDSNDDKSFQNKPIKKNFDKTVDVSQLDKKEENNTVDIEYSDKNSIAKEENKSENDVSGDIDSVLALDDVNSGYPDVLKLIEDKNAKTFHFLEKTMIDKVVDNNIYIVVNNLNDFSFDSLLKDQDFIADIFSNFFKCKCSISFIRGSVKETKKNDTNEGLEDSEHPLLMDVINKFKGDILR
ncbi:MAG: hypothetical protein CMG64_01660 [Candidatus Marinimicrobia bacterium]|nr:hypothetical protein [Candidatus Neomarinimicrobiota bacterium]|tara:strand:- start:10878 stop:12476 length:1599 start_codon:yes stop_codon:yes gene_type:complete